MALDDMRPIQERCSNCSFCKWIPFDKQQSLRFATACPAIGCYSWNIYSARGRMQLGRALSAGDVDYTPKAVDVVHSCLSCGACDVSCKICRYNMEPLENNMELKADAVKKGHILPVQAEMIESLKSEKTLIRGAKKENRTAWAKGLGLKDLTKEHAEVMFFAGCKYSYDEKLQPLAREAAKLLLDAGADLGFLAGSEMCCGGRAWQMGFFDEFEAHAQGNIALIKKAGVRTIVTPCSDCYHAFKRLYAQLGLDVEVLHIVEYVEKLINEGKIKFTKSLDVKVTYHDPCHLGRQGEPYVPWNGKEKKILNQIHTWDPPRPRYNGAYGIYDAPRNILKAIPGVELVEMERIREYSWCCGAGGGCSETDKKLSDYAASDRITEANTTGADVLVTACPWCKSNLSGACGEDGRSIEVADLLELVRKAM